MSLVQDSSVESVPGRDVDQDLFRGLFSRHAVGVAIITADVGKPAGFTATSLVSVSVEPPLLSFNVSRGASCWPTIEAAGYVGVHLLAEGQHELAATFSRSGADRFGPETAWRRGLFGVPIIEGAVGWMVCRVQARIMAGDHAVVIGEVVRAHYVDELGPLVYHRGRFTGLREQPKGSR
jgi:flavin reductase (DIM6/NTAB) family NADH-FMN oxidoreductase RutF